MMKEQLTTQTKGKVERGIDYVQENALKGRTFSSLPEQNGFLLRWETSVADTRIHGTTRKQVGKLFREEEKSSLLPLPATRFACFQKAKRSVRLCRTPLVVSKKSRMFAFCCPWSGHAS